MLCFEYTDLKQVSYMSTHLAISNMFFSRAESQLIANVTLSEPDHARSDGPTRPKCAGRRQRGRIARKPNMEHWPEDVPCMGRLPVGYAIKLSKSFFLRSLMTTNETRIIIKVGNFLRSRVSPPESPVPVVHDTNVPAEQQQQYLGPVNGLPAWASGSNLSMHVYFSTSPVGDVFGVTNRKNWGQAEATEGGFPHWTWDNITYGDWADSRKVDVMMEIPQVSFWFALR